MATSLLALGSPHTTLAKAKQDETVTGSKVVRDKAANAKP